jgi:hypothetical protein
MASDCADWMKPRRRSVYLSMFIAAPLNATTFGEKSFYTPRIRAVDGRRNDDIHHSDIRLR